MDQPLPNSSGQMKNRPFRERLGFALAGILTVARRERSFRAQCALGVVAIAVTAAVRPGFLWSAIVALAVALVLALELFNAALEYLIDHLHPGLAKEIGHAKDAAAGAVLLCSIGAVCVGALMMISEAVS
jgi:diacylglycerol kinase (ATP)